MSSGAPAPTRSPGDAPRQAGDARPIVLGNMRIDDAERRVVIGEATASLTRQEFELLRLLAQRPDATTAYASLTIELWGHDGPEERRRLAVVACRLRSKLVGSRPYGIVTVKKRGYRLGPAR